MYRSAMGVWIVVLCITVFVTASSYPSDSETNSHRELVRLAKVLNTLRKFELSGKGTLSQLLRPHHPATNHNRGEYRKHSNLHTRTRLSNQKEADQYKNLESFILSSENNGGDLSKRQGNWDYDYGLGGGRFGKRGHGDYGIGGGRFGRDAIDVDHVDLSDSE